MDASVLLPVVFLVSTYLSTVLVQGTEDIDYFAGRLLSREGEDRLHIWHSDCFSRCGWQLPSAIEIACNNDPYRIHDRRRKRSEHPSKDEMDTDINIIYSTLSSKYTQERDPSVFFTKRLASSFLHKGSSKRAISNRKKRGISEECCFNVCAWEEYAEYCQGHRRTRNRRPSRCL